MERPTPPDPAGRAPFAFAVCGWSGSGKTTLLESVIPVLVARGLRVAALKHDAHGIQADREGKDSDRLFRAGADVHLAGPREAMRRWHAGSAPSLSGTLSGLAREHDLVLVEGHKATPLAKVWLASEGESGAPPEAGDALAVLPRDADRPAALLALLDRWLAAAWTSAPLYGGVLIGGRSERMGRPKHLIESGGRTLLEIAAAALRPHVRELFALGAGELPAGLPALPRIPDAPGADGPLAGVRAALRWSRGGSWIVCACDHPHLTPAAVGWLVSQRAPGRWAIFPRSPDGFAQPFPGLYDARALEPLEAGAGVTPAGAAAQGPRALESLRQAWTPEIPPEFTAAWRGANRPGELPAG